MVIFNKLTLKIIYSFLKFNFINKRIIKYKIIECKIENNKNGFIFNKYIKITEISLNNVEHANDFFLNEKLI